MPAFTAKLRFHSRSGWCTLIRLEKEGILTSRWEDGSPVMLGRPKRRYYKITAIGQTVYNNEVRQIKGRSLKWAW
ncbi:MAG: PadR family transcriptional regulator [Pseudomonadota bacterium]|nr:PadR family transcriptional regulator [Pseudomonadota bacterium]